MSLEIKRRKLELSRVSVAREEQEFKIAEYQAQIERLMETIKIQIAKENQIKEELLKLEE